MKKCSTSPIIRELNQTHNELSLVRGGIIEKSASNKCQAGEKENPSTVGKLVRRCSYNGRKYGGFSKY